MTGTDATTDTSTETPEVSTIDMKLEVVTLPVSDVDRAKSFYQSLGWRLDADFAAGDEFRGVQFTPPHSQCSIHFGKGITTAEPGSVQRLELVVEDIDAARADLISRGVDVSEVFEQRPRASVGPRALVLRARLVQRSGRERLAAPRGHDPAPRPGVGGLT